ncbi:hypothetical protein [Bordetella genomosp. 9]|nr:hypothetical protein [Bordetella genomosp. 9]
MPLAVRLARRQAHIDNMELFPMNAKWLFWAFVVVVLVLLLAQPW